MIIMPYRLTTYDASGNHLSQHTYIDKDKAEQDFLRYQNMKSDGIYAVRLLIRGTETWTYDPRHLLQDA